MIFFRIIFALAFYYIGFAAAKIDGWWIAIPLVLFLFVYIAYMVVWENSIRGKGFYRRW